MKRILFTLAIVGTLVSMSSFKNRDTVTGKKDNVSPVVLQSFRSSFKNACEVKWTTKSNYYEANFSFNGQYVSAFYDVDGKLIAITRNVSPSQLPISLQSNLKNDYSAYWVSELFEFSNDEGTTYYITVENADTKIMLKSSSDSNWSLYKKQSKS
jgi:hypothetical protein